MGHPIRGWVVNYISRRRQTLGRYHTEEARGGWRREDKKVEWKEKQAVSHLPDLVEN